MEILTELVEIKNACLGLGFFDGVHFAHNRMIKELVEISKRNYAKSVILTFKTSPAEMFVKSVKYLTTRIEREDLISNLGVDYMIELDFDKHLSNVSAEDYLKMLYKYFTPKYILTGFNHTFGNGKSGDSQFLKNNKEKFGYIYKEISPVKIEGEIVSSTLIKNYLKKGDIKKANQLLGHDYNISGNVIKGNMIGRTIGFPTANIMYPDNKAEIPFGVYKVKAKIDNNIYPKALMNYGKKPTVNNGENKPVAEVHIIGFNSDIYGKTISISVIDKIRDEKKFGSLEELKKQINEDLKQC